MKHYCTICGTLRSNCRHGVPFCRNHDAPTSQCDCAMYACTDCGTSWYGQRAAHHCDNDHVIGPDMRRGAADKEHPRLTLEIRVVPKRCTHPSASRLYGSDTEVVCDNCGWSA